MHRHQIRHRTEAAVVGSTTVFGVFIGGIGQVGIQRSLGRKTIYQFNLLLFGVFAVLGAMAPTVDLARAARSSPVSASADERR